MRLVHLAFSLHAPYYLKKYDGDGHDYFDPKEKFKEADAQIYQPFFALMERNTQKHAALRFSLMVSGTWLELAEQYDVELIQRLRKMVKSGRVEIVAQPFYHSLAFFYDKEEFTEQVQLLQKKVRDLFDAECRMFAAPDLMYNDALGKWAEDFGFAGMLVGGAEKALAWRSPNHVYEAAGCEYLRLLFQNRFLGDKLAHGDPSLMEKLKPDAEKETLSVKKFQKLLDLECLRGNLVNLYFDAAMIAKQRENGIVALFDRFFESWLAVSGNKFVKATEACVIETPTMAVSVKQTVDWKTLASDGENDQAQWSKYAPNLEKLANEQIATGLVLAADVTYTAPRRYEAAKVRKKAQDLYKLRRLALAAEDDYLIRDFRRLSALDFLADVSDEDLAIWEKILQDLQVRADEIKKSQAEVISKVFTKKRDRGLDDDAVVVNFGSGKKTDGGAADVDADVDINDAEKQPEVKKMTTDQAPKMVRVDVEVKNGVNELKASRNKQTGGVDVRVVDKPEIELPSVEVAKDEDETTSETATETETKPKKRRIKKIIKKLVIE